jgi:hypothetical protein
MHSRKLATAAAILSVSLPVTALAQDNGDATEDLDLTIRLMPEGASEGSEITRTITLPDSVPERVGRTVPGENAGQDAGARGEGGRPDDVGPGGVSLPEVDAPGLDVAEDAIAGEGGREFGQELRDRMNDNREERGRGQPPEDLPLPGETGADAGPPGDVPTPDTPAGPPGD